MKVDIYAAEGGGLTLYLKAGTRPEEVLAGDEWQRFSPIPLQSGMESADLGLKRTARLSLERDLAARSYHIVSARPAVDQGDSDGYLDRRGFLAAAGAGAAGLALGSSLGHAKAAAAEEVIPAGTTVRVRLKVNGDSHELLAEPRWTLLYVLREKLGLTGTKAGCERGECGACTVLMDGVPRYACLTLAVEAQGMEITTLEGLMQGEELGITQQTFLEHDAYQCGYCTPGQIMAAEGLLRKHPEPGSDQVRWGMSGNLCRCGAYEHIFQAVHSAARRKRGG